MDGFAEFGWRGRIGYIVAIPVIEHMPYEFYQMAPKGVGIVITSLGKKDQGANEKVKVFLEAEGFKVLHAKGLEAKLTAIGRLPGSLAYRLAKEAVQEAPERPQAVYLAGGLLRATGQVALLEQDLGVPVVASHAAFIWAACRALSIHETIKGYGKLLETLSEAKP